MKSKIILSITIITIIFSAAFYFSREKSVAEETTQKNPITVTLQSVKNSRYFKETINYPAILSSENQVNLIANNSGIISKINFDLGKNVYRNQKLATVDSLGIISTTGENGLKDSQIQSLELTVKSAEQGYKLARDNYRKDDTYANKKAKEIAAINLSSAQTNLKGALDGQFIIAPISGTVSQKNVSLGDSVNTGQVIATISQLDKLKIQFFVNKEELSYFKIGDLVNIKENETAVQGKISLISPLADESTKRFMIEAIPVENKKFLIGSVANVEFDINYQPAIEGNLILPLAAITISQNESYIFINKDGKSKKVLATIHRVLGEMAEIKADLDENDLIIVNGNKLLKEGDAITLKK